MMAFFRQPAGHDTEGGCQTSVKVEKPWGKTMEYPLSKRHIPFIGRFLFLKKTATCFFIILVFQIHLHYSSFFMFMFICGDLHPCRSASSKMQLGAGCTASGRPGGVATSLGCFTVVSFVWRWLISQWFRFN